ncbi:hypothetical protein LPJ73_003196, partial [Coemansia sp. RSA 2703]
LDDFGLVDYESPYLEAHDDELPEEPTEETTEEAAVSKAVISESAAVLDINVHLESDLKTDQQLLPEAPLSATASIFEGADDLIDYEDSDVENADEDGGGADNEAIAYENNGGDGDINDGNVVKTEAVAEVEAEKQHHDLLESTHNTEDIDGVYDYTDVHSVSSSRSGSDGYYDTELDFGLDQDFVEQQDQVNVYQDQERLEPSLDTDDAVIDLTDDMAAGVKSEWSVPEVWVCSEGEWMTYLGPGQSTYDEEMQLTLFMMPIDQLIEFLQSEIMLGAETMVSLEFPSLALVIDQRDRESSDINLSQIYNWHQAAVRLGKVSVDVVNSPYFSVNTLNSFIPSPDSLSFIIHTRPAVHSTIQRIMQLVEENQQQQQQHVANDAVEINGGGEELNGSGEHDESANAADSAAVPNGKGKEHADDVVDLDDDEEGEETGSTADLLAEDDGEDGEDEDEDFAPEDEDANDHKLDADALEGDDLEDEVQEEEDEAEVSSYKRGSEHMSPSSDNPDDDDGEVAEPVAKKARSETENDSGETTTAADANDETVGAEGVTA